MARPIVVIERHSDWPDPPAGINCMSAKDYLTSTELAASTDIQIINLSRNMRYQGIGYYTSLLAEARGHRVLPSVATMLTLTNRRIYDLELDDLDELVERAVGRAHRGKDADRFTLDVFFGQCPQSELEDLARQLFEALPAPLLQVEFRRSPGWQIQSVRAIAVHKLSAPQRAAFDHALQKFLRRRRDKARPRASYRYDMAILHNPKDPMPPTDKGTMKHFIRAGRQQGLDVELIEPRDYGRLAEYDALFIRDTTRIDHYTYRFARKAESEDMVVIDDPTSILRCTNKVFLDELLSANGVPRPRSRILYKSDGARVVRQVESGFGYPVVLKLPDSAFSAGVFKASNAAELKAITDQLFQRSDLILAQEWLYTEFDWRVGILNRTPLYVCQYFMSKRHWQIIKHRDDGAVQQGGYKAWQVGDAPPTVVAAALSAANLIGDGLYGVDVKETADGVYVIEVNDNPSIESSVEDGILKGELYNVIMREFVRRLDLRTLPH
ncbi:MAG: RimK family protein [Chromatiales bacterium]|nr:RimK family protein [Chromatiales bacterium]